MSYFDIDMILSEETNVSSTFLHPVIGVGYLDQQGYDIDDIIREGTKVSVPLWLALPIAQRGIVTISLPQVIIVYADLNQYR